MKKCLLYIVLFFSIHASMAQIGVVKLGRCDIGKDSVFVPDIAKAKTPLCPMPGPCNSNCAVYTFIGSGNWSIDGNWEAGVKPPAVLSGCVQIVINPIANHECVLNVPLQIIPPGASITVLSGKKLRVPGRLLRE